MKTLLALMLSAVSLNALANGPDAHWELAQKKEDLQQELALLELELDVAKDVNRASTIAAFQMSTETGLLLHKKTVTKDESGNYIITIVLGE